MERLLMPALLFASLLTTGAQAQPVALCDVKNIEPEKNSPPANTKRINDNMSCLLSKIQKLESDLKELQNRPAGGGSDLNPEPAPKVVDAGGIRAAIKAIHMSSDKNDITADISIKNITSQPLSLAIIPSESDFNIPGMAAKYSLNPKGLYNCPYDTARCKTEDDDNWSSLQPGQYTSLQIPYPFVGNPKAKTASVQFRLIIKIMEEKRSHDYSFQDIEVK